MQLPNVERAFVAELRAENFRNYEHLEVHLEPGFNLVFGANAQGKTSFLEAVFMVCAGRLLRGSRDAEAIRQDCDHARLQAKVSELGEEIRVDLYRGLAKKIEVNGNRLRRACDLLGKSPAIALGVADIAIVNGDPADRRSFLDTELAQLFPSYLQALTLYRRALEQRNALLRRAADVPVSDDLFRVWEAVLAQNGAFMRHQRKRTLVEIASHAQIAHGELGDSELLALSYALKDSAETAEELEISYASMRSEDVRRGTTSIGPHRDDFQINIEAREARVYASQGQRRTAMIAIKVGLWRLASEVLGQPPILLLDDIFSDLDQHRRSRLSQMLVGHRGQAILTCTERELAGSAGFQPAASFAVLSGTVSRI